MLGRTTRPNSAPTLDDRVLQADDRDDVHALQLGVVADRDRHAAALDLDELHLVHVGQRPQLLVGQLEARLAR